MVKEEKYSGTKGLTVDIAIKRLYELLDKSPLGNKDKEFYDEAKGFIDKELKEVIKQSDYWNIIKDKLTARQLLTILEK